VRIVIAAVGRLKAGHERDLAERYRDRAMKAGRALGFRDLEVLELRESRARETEQRRSEEAIALATILPDGALVIALDAGGKNLDSPTIAADLAAWRDTGRASVAFLIGGADGLGPRIKARADFTFAFGAATWPHQLVRIMLLEQLYRAMTILSGHPYHRE
jgi:23S rRNA (pseudouridine1915-N3)-methyltransferase